MAGTLGGFRLRRFVVVILMITYCLTIFLALDFLYTKFIRYPDAPKRIPDPVFNHTLVPNYDGYDAWVDRRYRFITNSRGFRDSAMRDVSAKPSSRRVLLIGDRRFIHRGNRRAIRRVLRRHADAKR
jgi:hypothetical protein